MPPLPIEQQFAIIRDSDFIERIQAKGLEVTQTLGAMQVNIEGGVAFRINQVLVKVRIINENETDVAVGEGPGGKPLYEWRVPLNWMTQSDDQTIPGDPAPPA